MALFVTGMLVDLSVAITHVTVSVAIMPLEIFAALMQMTVSAANTWVTIFFCIHADRSLHYNYAGGIFCSGLCT